MEGKGSMGVYWECFERRLACKIEAKIKVWKHKYDKIWGWIGGWGGGGVLGFEIKLKWGVVWSKWGVN